MPPSRPEGRSGATGSSREVHSPTAFSPSGAAARLSDRASQARPAYAFRFSRPLGVFVRPGPAGLVSCQIRSWGSPFRALLLPCSRTPSPAPLPSCRWNALPNRPSRHWPSRAPKRRAEPPPPHMDGPSEHPRLQGFAPHENPPLRPGGLGRHAARSSPGIPPLQGFLPHRTDATFITPPLMRFSARAQATLRMPLQGFTTR